MRLSQALKDKIMDLRLRDKLIYDGKITKEQVKQYLDSLSDDTSSFVEVGGAEKRTNDTDIEDDSTL